MANLNKCYLIGNCTRDPDIRYTPKGTQVVELGLAVNRVYSSEDGEKKEETTFVDVTLWGRTAEIAAQYLSKGKPCMIEGRLQLDSWDDRQTGQKRSKLRVVAEHLQLLGSRQDSEGASTRAARPPVPRPVGQAPPRKGIVEPDLDAAVPRTAPPRAGTGGPDPDDEPSDIPF
jgi:single-strand DNA-binding protein